MVEESGSSGVGSKDRDQRLQSAKKKLKSYRAKQAQMEKAKRTSMISNAGSNVSSSSISISPSRLVGSVLNDASYASQAAMAGASNGNSFGISESMSGRRHSRTMSRSGAGHGRGHSRTGSISLSQAALAGGVAAAALDHIAASQKVKSNNTTTRPVSSHFVNTAHSHTRGHSRSGSRSLAAKSRPTSLVAVQPETVERAWQDESGVVVNEDMLKTPTMDENGASFEDMDATPQQATLHRAITAPTSTITAVIPSALATSSSSSSSLANRRSSRHSRKGSVSTRRESMELMGGLGSLINGISTFDQSTSKRHSRRSSSHRWSGLQSASILFGGMPDFSSRRDGDGDSSEDEGGDRLTALEKLEGKNRRDSQQTSVQLPSFDDVHGDEAMDKRASLTLLESNVNTTNSDRPLNSVPRSRPQTMIEPIGDEGLGTLMEEEEEEEEAAASTPVKERGGIDFVAEEEKRKRKEAEQEVIKRTRRGSLTPKPLKLKSRPASLFVAPRPSGLSASTSLPILEHQEEREEEEEEEEAAAAPVSIDTESTISTGQTPTSSTFAETQQEKVKSPQRMEAFTRPVAPFTTPSKETKRAWRSSMPIATPSPLSSQHSTSPLNTTASAGRAGMRTLRLGSNMGISPVSSGPSPLQQHKNHTDSTSSFTSTVSNSSAAISKRGSLLYNVSPLNATNSRDETSPLAKKRSSFIYKSSPLEGASIGELSSAQSPTPLQPSSSSSSSATTPTTSIGGVPMSMFEELKSKHQRELGLLDEARTKIVRLEGEMRSEVERLGREYAELERWSAEEKRTLGQRIEYLEASIVEVVQIREAKEQDHVEEKQRIEEDSARIKSESEDIEAERDMLRDDVEGWRTRCSDLEKNLRAERQALEELKHMKMASKLRIKELLLKLEENDVVVERSSLDEEELSPELKAVLRSPAVDPSSPMLSAQRDRSMSPIHGDSSSQLPPPQAVQLLKEMRQQIFNLAGSLDHERKQHLLTKQEADELRSELVARERRPSILHDQSMADTTTTTTVDSHFFSPEKVKREEEETHGEMMSVPTASTPPQAAATNERQTFGSVIGKSTKKKRNHVFAYDSSMESGCGSYSLGSGSATTNQTSELHHEDGEENVEGLQEGKDEDFVAQVQADLVGLGMGSLDTLDEEEEVASELMDSNAMTESASRVKEQSRPGSMLRDSFDIESGRRVSDVESIAPSTPALEHGYYPYNHEASSVVASTPVSTLPLNGSTSTSSSNESHGPPSPFGSAALSSQETITTPMDAKDDDFYSSSYEEEKPIARAPRPEFIREWSFENATAASRANSTTKTSSTRSRTMVAKGTTTTPFQKQKQPRNRKMSIDDFFGIMSLDESQKLPPLPTPEEALEMPPLFIEPYSGRMMMNDLGYGVQQRRYPSQIRPPIPRTSSLYNQSGSDRSSSSTSSSSKRQLSNQSYNSGSDLAANTSLGGGMFSRVASLTSAFSGLGGYLIGSSPAVNASNDEDDYDSHNTSSTWAVTRREEEMA